MLINSFLHLYIKSINFYFYSKKKNDKTLPNTTYIPLISLNSNSELPNISSSMRHCNTTTSRLGSNCTLKGKVEESCNNHMWPFLDD